MRQFASTGFRLWNLSPEAKLVYSGFCVMSLAALAVSALFYEDLVGTRTSGIGAYYAGEDAGGRAGSRAGAGMPAPRATSPAAGQPGAPPPPTKGPQIELPGDATGEEQDTAGADAKTGETKAAGSARRGAAASAQQRLSVAVTYRKLLEVTHFHLFTVPVFLLIIAHLFMLTGLGSRTKILWIAGAWVSAFGHLAAPWLVRYGGGGWSWSYAVSGAGLALTTMVMTGYPMWSMWFGRPPKRPGIDGSAPSETDASPAA